MIDLNVDIGEGFPWDFELLQLVTSANVCLGVHAGSAELTQITLDHCRKRGVRVGLHPGFPDRETMGRSVWPAHRLTEARDSLLAQVSIWSDATTAEYIKPHGALYLQSSREPLWAELVTEVLRECGLPLMGLQGTLHQEIADCASVPLIREGFADRRKDPLGFLIPRDATGAFVAACDQLAHVGGQLGDVDSICFHGDVQDCVENLRALRKSLECLGGVVGNP